MYVRAASCSRPRFPACCDVWSSCVCSFATRLSSSRVFALSTSPRSEMPTPTRMPMIRARKTAASEATWYRRSNISELRGSLAQGVQTAERVAGQGASQPDEKRPADGELGGRAIVVCAGECQLHVEPFSGHVPGQATRWLDREQDERAGHLGVANQARAQRAVERPTRTGSETPPVGVHARDTRPPVRKVMRLGKEAPDILACREELPGGRVSGHSGRSVAVPAQPRAPRARTPVIGSTRGRGLGYRRKDMAEAAASQRSPEAEQVPDALVQEPDEMAEPGRGGDRDHYRTEPGDGEGHQRPEPDLPAHEAGDAFRVDEDLPHLQARHEGRRHSGPVALEELGQVEVCPDGDDQLRALLEGEQERDVLADPGRRHGRVGEV